MSAFDFVSHESYPEDQFIAESVVICIDGKHRVTYIRKKMQSGGMFWDVISAVVKQHGEKKYLKSYSQDSNFLAEDIKHFLDNRGWESKSISREVNVGVQVAKSEVDDAVPF
jgi:hypothetical protein